MPSGPRCICPECRHFDQNAPLVNEAGKAAPGWVCVAFPAGIPSSIATMAHDHRRAFDGDGGVRFEPLEGSKVSPNPADPLPWDNQEELNDKKV
jgi:hypothetical protein